VRLNFKARNPEKVGNEEESKAEKDGLRKLNLKAREPGRKNQPKTSWGSGNNLPFCLTFLCSRFFLAFWLSN
jgi:hypothetical protein